MPLEAMGILFIAQNGTVPNADQYMIRLWLKESISVACAERICEVRKMRLDEWCDDCKEYDKENHSCPRFNRVIRETLDDVRKEAYKHGKSKGIKRGMAMARRKEAGGD